MNKYELALVVSARIEDEERAAVVENCKGLITRFGGTVTKVDEWGKRRLAYEIQKMREAYYYFISFEAEPIAPVEIESRVRIMDKVIRYLIVKQDETKGRNRRDRKAAREAADAPVTDAGVTEEEAVESDAAEAPEPEAVPQETPVTEADGGQAVPAGQPEAVPGEE